MHKIRKECMRIYNVGSLENKFPFICSKKKLFLACRWKNIQMANKKQKLKRVKERWKRFLFVFEPEKLSNSDQYGDLEE